MSDEKIKNALTEEEIAALDRGVPEEPGYHEIEWYQAEIDIADAAIAKLRALRGFSKEDVEALRYFALKAHELSWMLDGRVDTASLRSIASRIPALLPPEK